jgi:hypothetical protein
MFRWFSVPKKKEEDDEFMLLDIDTSTDVISDTISVMTSSVSIEPEFVCKYYSFEELCDPCPNEQAPAIEVIEEAVPEVAETVKEYNYADVEDITEEINAMKVNVFSDPPAFQIDDPSEDFIERSVRVMVEFMRTTDTMVERFVASTLLL